MYPAWLTASLNSYGVVAGPLGFYGRAPLYDYLGPRRDTVAEAEADLDWYDACANGTCRMSGLQAAQARQETHT